LSSEVSWLAIFVRISGVPEPGRSNEAVCAAQAGRKRGSAFDLRIPARTGAVHLGHRGASSGREVLRRLSNLKRGLQPEHIAARRSNRIPREQAAEIKDV